MGLSQLLQSIGTLMAGIPKHIPHGICSFCRKSYKDVEPLFEGPNGVFICTACVKLGINTLDAEYKRRGLPSPFREPDTAESTHD